MAPARPHIFTIPSGIPFARALSEGVIARSGSDPLLLADALVLVPTRRAARALREIFARVLGGAALLPHIHALGDIDDEEQSFDPSTEDLRALAPVAPLRRRLLLATLVRQWGEAKHAPIPFTQCLAYAGELARFLDEAVTQNADLAKLKTLASDSMAAHWSEVVQFLDIVAVQWPELLRAEGAAEPAASRDGRLRALGAELARNPPRAPVIAAGSTGSIPATAELLNVIAHLPTGAVVLPGLDSDLDGPSWKELEPAHAQFGLRQLLTHIGVEREDVHLWSPLPGSYRARSQRVHFLSEALRPPPTTDVWRDLVEKSGRDLAPALEDFALIEAQNPREEALVIACALREVLETKGRTAALVTPDRSLARRVAAELTRWDITIDDSAGEKLSRTPPGAFLALAARAAAERFAPVPLLALLKHPFAAGGEERSQFRRHVRALERAALRGLRPDPGLAGIATRLRNVKAPFALQNWFAKLTVMFEPFEHAMAAKDSSLGELAQAHGRIVEALAATNTEPGANTMWRGPAGEAAANLIQELIRDGVGITLAPARDYADTFRELAEQRAVRPRYNLHPRLAILGPLEARLLDFDLVILSGLNEGQWPAEAATDPWLSRPMRESLGLDAPERRTGLAAHDFAALAALPSVLITRSLKENGAPTVASRWLLRIKQLAKGLTIESALNQRNDLLAWARALDDGPHEKRAPRPEPRPPVAARPRALSVTEIETWLRDPYAIYAKHVLRLRPLEPIDSEPGPRERGNAIHAVLERFLNAFPAALPPDALENLLRFGEEAFKEAGATQAILALWTPRFERAARWFLAYERARRHRITKSCVEVKGTLEILAQEKFILRGRADRIDFFSGDAASVLDYKTGRVPSHKQIELLLSPQLPLEGAMLLAGALGDFRATSLREFIHIRLTGSEPPGREVVAAVDANAKANEALARLTARVARYDNPAQPYRSREMPFRMSDEGDYDHLARVREWTLEERLDE
ncbi:MAG TPA: double-strand break repair protein AddB [Micropepsaceae bacterium]|nr:double-strand break repair protein AddB [Micropepsaceae bacterium]